MTVCGFYTCPDPAAHTYTAGCVHEHVGTEHVCQRHHDLIRRPASEPFCIPCERAGHDCPVVVRWHNQPPPPGAH